MGEWRELAERLVELDLAIEDTDSWATSPDDIAELRRLERLGGTRYKPPSTNTESLVGCVDSSKDTS
jgi:hypothetical protein